MTSTLITDSVSSSVPLAHTEGAAEMGTQVKQTTSSLSLAHYHASESLLRQRAVVYERALYGGNALAIETARFHYNNTLDLWRGARRAYVDDCGETV